MENYQTATDYQALKYQRKRNNSLEYKLPKLYSKAAVSGGYSGKHASTLNLNAYIN